MDSFSKKGYRVIRNLISKKEAKEINDYLNNRNDGSLCDPQSLGTPSFYEDQFLMKKQIKLLPEIEKHSDLKLFKTYNYARKYKKGDILRLHADRPACEISVTLDLGGDPWSIWILDKDENAIKVDLESGDALLYRGCDLLHWRGKFEGNYHPQVFLHYVDQNGPYAWAKDDVKRSA